MSIPKRGEVWWADFGLAGKVRPALVISVPFGDNDRALIGVIPHSTSLYGSEFEVKAGLRGLEKAGAFVVQTGVPLAPTKFIRRIGVLGVDQMCQIESVLKKWQGLT